MVSPWVVLDWLSAVGVGIGEHKWQVFYQLEAPVCKTSEPKPTGTRTGGFQIPTLLYALKESKRKNVSEPEIWLRTVLTRASTNFNSIPLSRKNHKIQEHIVQEFNAERSTLFLPRLISIPFISSSPRLRTLHISQISLMVSGCIWSSSPRSERSGHYKHEDIARGSYRREESI